VLPIAEWYGKQVAKKLPIYYGAAAGWTFARIATFAVEQPVPSQALFGPSAR
jgi:N-acyl-D-glutamate deacylase